MSEQVTSIAYHNFINTCRNSTTQKSYKKSLEYFMKFLKVGNWDNPVVADGKKLSLNILREWQKSIRVSVFTSNGS
jgi:hypothetical protein